MRKSLLFIAAALCTMQAKAQMAYDTVYTGAGYANQVWYSLLNDEQGTEPINNWDLGFEMGGIGTSILVNTASGAMLWNYPKDDISGWSSVDTTGLSTWQARYNSDFSWSAGAMGAYADPNDPVDMDWGKYNMTTHVVTGDSLYIIKLVNGNYKKLKIDKLQSGTYTFTYANIDGTNEQVQTLVKANYAGKNFGYFSIVNDAPLNREPLAEDWDLLFTKYTTQIMGFGPYGVTGVLGNKEVQAAKVTNVADVNTYNAWTSHSFGQSISEIGYDWKAYDMQANQYVVEDSLVYFVLSKPTDIWKVVFTGFTGSADGGFMFGKERLHSLSVEDAQGKVAATVALHPNPATGQDVTLVYNFESNQKQAKLSVYDMSGRVVHNVTLETAKGMHQYRLQTSNYSSGYYIVSVETENNRIQQKLVIR